MNEFQHKVSAALAVKNARQRNRRGRRATGIERIAGPSMVRLPRP